MKKRILATLLCGVILASAVSCNTKEKNADQATETTAQQSTEAETTVEILTKNPEGEEGQFLSKQVRESWRGALLSFLSTHDRNDYLGGIGGSYAMGLMDLDFDNIPEVLIAYPGGSMGNVFLMIYDLATGENITDYNAGYFGKGTDVCFSVAFQNGAPVILEEGNMRALDIGYLDRVKVLPKTVKTLEEDAKQVFAASEADGYYAVDGQEVEKSEYEAKYQQFWKEYEKIEATMLRLIMWSTVESDTPEKTAEKMVDALINSSQAFIDYTKQPTEKPTEKASVFGDYQDLLGTLVLLQQENGLEKFRAEHPNLDEREEKLLTSLCEVDARAMGYCVKDVTSDGVDDLLLLYSNFSIRALYTMHEGMPVFIRLFDNDGSVFFDSLRDYVKIYNYLQVNEGTLSKRVYSLGTIKDGKYVEIATVGYTYHTDTREETDFFWTENGELRSADAFTVYEELERFENGASFSSNPAKLTYTAILEDDTHAVGKNQHYKITQANGAFKIEVFDKNGVCVYSDEHTDKIYCYFDEDILRIVYSSPSGYYGYKYRFYNISTNRLSEIFENVTAFRGELVAYTVEEGNTPCLVVENVFDKTALQQKFECPQQVSSAYFALDGKSIEISFGSYSKPSKRVFCFENLPILKVTTICYVRYSTSVQGNGNVYYINSGNPALLRPANGDTVRLLETVEGGTYKDADGNERNDWHKILYSGEVCFVTADSFEVLTYEVK